MAGALAANVTVMDWAVPMILAACALTAIGAAGRMALGPRYDPPRVDAAAPRLLVGAIVVASVTAVIGAIA